MTTFFFFFWGRCCIIIIFLWYSQLHLLCLCLTVTAPIKQCVGLMRCDLYVNTLCDVGGQEKKSTLAFSCVWFRLGLIPKNSRKQIGSSWYSTASYKKKGGSFGFRDHGGPATWSIVYSNPRIYSKFFYPWWENIVVILYYTPKILIYICLGYNALMCILQLLQYSTILWMDRATKKVKLGATTKTLPKQQHILSSSPY